MLRYLEANETAKWRGGGCQSPRANSTWLSPFFPTEVLPQEARLAVLPTLWADSSSQHSGVPASPSRLGARGLQQRAAADSGMVRSPRTRTEALRRRLGMRLLPPSQSMAGPVVAEAPARKKLSAGCRPRPHLPVRLSEESKRSCTKCPTN